MKEILEIKQRKKNIREKIWKILEEKNVAIFPGAWGRIPNFKGAEKCIKFLKNIPEWEKAKFIKSNPDSPQKHLREFALKEGKIVYMATPKLKELKCFIKIDPQKIKNISFASTIKGAFLLGEKVSPEEIERIDLIIAGSVAVNLNGKRIGKGGGYSDLEYAIGKHFGFIKENTKIITTVHELQIVEDDIPFLPYDIPVDYIITPSNFYKINSNIKKPQGILWEFLDEQKIENIPILKEIKKFHKI
jgi:5-formyltetrahydrofolate cyclo-ligase